MFGKKKVRYAVVGGGWFAQEAVLPGFAGADNSELAAIVSGENREPEPAGVDGIIDLAIIDGIKESIRTNRAVAVGPFPPRERPTAALEHKSSRVSPPELVHAGLPTGK